MTKPLLAILLLLPLSALAQTQVPNVFEDGTPASAAEVNANFDALEAALPPSNCTTDQIIKWNGSAWVCAADSGITLQSGRDAIDIRSVTSTNANVVVYCEEGERVTGGGYRDDSGGAAPYLCQPFVPQPEGAPTDGYRCKWSSSGIERTVYAVCF